MKALIELVIHNRIQQPLHSVVYKGALPMNHESITVYVPRSLGVSERVPKIWLTFADVKPT